MTESHPDHPERCGGSGRIPDPNADPLDGPWSKPCPGCADCQPKPHPVGKLTQRIRDQQRATPSPDDERSFTVTWEKGYEPTPEDEAAVAELVEAAWKKLDNDNSDPVPSDHPESPAVQAMQAADETLAGMPDPASDHPERRPADLRYGYHTGDVLICSLSMLSMGVLIGSDWSGLWAALVALSLMAVWCVGAWKLTPRGRPLP